MEKARDSGMEELDSVGEFVFVAERVIGLFLVRFPLNLANSISTSSSFGISVMDVFREERKRELPVSSESLSVPWPYFRKNSSIFSNPAESRATVLRRQLTLTRENSNYQFVVVLTPSMDKNIHSFPSAVSYTDY